MLELFKNRNYALLWSGNLISVAGDWLVKMAMTFWVYDVSGGSPVATSLMFLTNLIPSLIFGSVAGVFVDRWDRRRVMIVADLVRASLAALQLVAVFTKNIPLAFVIAFSQATIGQFFQPARQAIIPEIVSKELLVAANGLANATSNGLLVVGPALGTSVYYLLGPVASFSLDSVSFLISAATSVGLRIPQTAVNKGKATFSRLWSEYREGLIYLFSNRVVRTITLTFFVLMLGGGAVNVSELFLVTRDLGLPKEMLSWLMSVYGAAMFVASVLLALLGKRVSRHDLLVSGGVVVGGAGLVLLSVSPNLAWAVAANIITALGNAAMNIGVGTLMQSAIPAEIRGRVFGAISPLVTLAILVSTAAAGVLIEYMSARIIFAGGGAFLVASGILAQFGLREARPAAETKSA